MKKEKDGGFSALVLWRFFCQAEKHCLPEEALVNALPPDAWQSYHQALSCVGTDLEQAHRCMRFVEQSLAFEGLGMPEFLLNFKARIEQMLAPAPTLAT